jgi:hypothetical protein
MIAEAAGRSSFVELLHSRVLDRVKLGETFFDGGESTGSFALAPNQGDNGADNSEAFDMSWAWGFGNVAATPGDVARWIEVVGSGAFFNPAMQKDLLTPVATDDTNVKQGLGFLLFGQDFTGVDEVGIGHDGDIDGYHSAAYYYPKHRVTVVATMDYEANAEDDRRAIMRAATATLFGAAP